MRNKLYRDEQHKKIGGVCAGLAAYFDVDISLVRVLFVLAVVLGGSGVLAYIILWIVIPPMPLVSPSDDFFNSSQPGSQSQPYAPAKPHTVTTGSIVGGLILILLGIYLTLDQFNIIPGFDFNTFWPLVLIIIGLILMFGFWQKKPVEQPTSTWDNKDKTTDTSSTDNSQTI